MPENASTKGAFLNATTGNRNSGGNRRSYQDKDKPAQIRFSNISAGKEVADAAARTSLGPKGMDNMDQLSTVKKSAVNKYTTDEHWYGSREDLEKDIKLL